MQGMCFYDWRPSKIVVDGIRLSEPVLRAYDEDKGEFITCEPKEKIDTDTLQKVCDKIYNSIR